MGWCHLRGQQAYRWPSPWTNWTLSLSLLLAVSLSFLNNQHETSGIFQMTQREIFVMHLSDAELIIQSQDEEAMKWNTEQSWSVLKSWLHIISLIWILTMNQSGNFYTKGNDHNLIYKNVKGGLQGLSGSDLWESNGTFLPHPLRPRNLLKRL